MYDEVQNVSWNFSGSIFEQVLTRLRFDIWINNFYTEQ